MHFYTHAYLQRLFLGCVPKEYSKHVEINSVDSDSAPEHMQVPAVGIPVSSPNLVIQCVHKQTHQVIGLHSEKY